MGEVVDVLGQGCMQQHGAINRDRKRTASTIYPLNKKSVERRRSFRFGPLSARVSAFKASSLNLRLSSSRLPRIGRIRDFTSKRRVDSSLHSDCLVNRPRAIPRRLASIPSKKSVNRYRPTTKLSLTETSGRRSLPLGCADEGIFGEL